MNEWEPGASGILPIRAPPPPENEFQISTPLPVHPPVARFAAAAPAVMLLPLLVIIISRRPRDGCRATDKTRPSAVLAPPPR
eukprot:scaffold1383_cov360-Prasinococcus_capsulatus_cf.AAC.7